MCPVGIEETLQNQDGSHLIDDLPMAGKRPSGSMEVAMGLGGGQALIPKVDGEGELGVEDVGEGVGLCGLGAEVAGHVEGIAQHNGGTIELAEQAAQRLQVLLRVFADEGEDGLSGEAQLIGHRDADTAVTEIEAEQAGFHRSKDKRRTERL